MRGPRVHPPLSEAETLELFVLTRSLDALGAAEANTRAQLGLTRFGSLLATPQVAFSWSPIGDWLLKCCARARAETLDGEAMSFLAYAAWHASDMLTPLSILAAAFDWRQKDVLLALALDAHAPSFRSLKVIGWLMAHTAPGCADELALALAATCERHVGSMLQQRELHRAAAIELLAELCMHAPASAEPFAPVLRRALLLESACVRELAVAAVSDVLFSLISRSYDGPPAPPASELGSMYELLRWLPGLMWAPTAAMQKAAVVGVTRIIVHTAEPAFAASLERAANEDTFGDRLLFKLVLRHVDVGAAAPTSGADEPGGCSRIATSLSFEANQEVLKLIDKALEAVDDGMLADCVIFVALNALANGDIAPSSPDWASRSGGKYRRSLNELIRRVRSPALCQGVPESLADMCFEHFGVAPSLGCVRSWLGMQQPHGERDRGGGARDHDVDGSGTITAMRTPGAVTTDSEGHAAEQLAGSHVQAHGSPGARPHAPSALPFALRFDEFDL